MKVLHFAQSHVSSFTFMISTLLKLDIQTRNMSVFAMLEMTPESSMMFVQNGRESDSVSVLFLPNSLKVEPFMGVRTIV